jgi:hypothetical protein
MVLGVVGGLVVATSALPGGTAGVPYSAQLLASGGTPPYKWSATGLPSGLSVDSSSGAISGTPAQSGSFGVDVTVTDSAGIVSSKVFKLSIAPASAPPGMKPTAPTPAFAALTALRVSPRALALAGRRVKGKCVGATAKNKHHPSCKRPIKLTISYTLNRADTVTFTLVLKSVGREVGGNCVKATAGNHKHKRCMLTVALPGKITVPSAAGADMYVFNGKIGGHALAAGIYELTATPGGGAPEATPFKIVS